MFHKRFLIAWLLTAVVLFILNGIFHGLLMADFFDRHMAGLAPAVVQMKDFNPAPIVVLELIIDGVIVWIIAQSGMAVTTRNACMVGALVYLAGSSTWNLANRATFVSWPTVMAVVDIAWHVITGVLAGAIVAWIWNRGGSQHQADAAQV